MENPYKRKLKTINSLIDLYDKLKKANLNPIDNDNYIIIKIYDLTNLHNIRKKIKKIYPKWQDKLVQIWNSHKEFILASYEDYNFPLLHIWFECHVDNFPKELLPNETCRFEKIQTEQYNLVCNV